MKKIFSFSDQSIGRLLCKMLTSGKKLNRCFPKPETTSTKVTLQTQEARKNLFTNPESEPKTGFYAPWLFFHQSLVHKTFAKISHINSFPKSRKVPFLPVKEPDSHRNWLIDWLTCWLISLMTFFHLTSSRKRINKHTFSPKSSLHPEPPSLRWSIAAFSPNPHQTLRTRRFGGEREERLCWSLKAACERVRPQVVICPANVFHTQRERLMRNLSAFEQIRL